MTRPYLRGRRRYLLLEWEPAEALTKGALIALVSEKLAPLSMEQAPQTGRMVKAIRPSLMRFEPPRAMVMVDHRFELQARKMLNTHWHQATVRTLGCSGTLKSLQEQTTSR